MQQAETPPGAGLRGAQVHVWSRTVRIGHWLLAASVLSCLLLYEGGIWHERLGYAALVLAIWRIAFGLLTQDRFASFRFFMRGPRATMAYARAMLKHDEAHHVGHNPLGAWMIAALLLAAAIAGASGAIYATDAFWGDPVLYTIHQIAGWAVAILVPLHIGGVVLTSVLQRENLLLAMVTGVKQVQPPATDAAVRRPSTGVTRD